ncbi:MAG: molybdopterin-dependent oxidoreductase [Deltaproteobacteria bacterium]|nr:molybdopterin-dependent oxidoreductase [Deltaproteobacteria bacterium]
MIRATIDGKKVVVPEETTILKAARQAGIHIPTLCYMDKLTPMIACRICLVEVEGTDKPVAACNTPVVDDMVVTTQSEELTRLRKEAIQFLLIDHPLECPVCDAGGECNLQNLTYELGVTQKEYMLEAMEPKINYDWPLIEHHSDRCVRCLRCINICWEVQGFGAYRLAGQGYETYITTVDGGPLNCDFCGQCVQACPVGALIHKPYKFKARSWELTRIPSVCPHCGRGCNVELHVKDGRLLRVMSADEETINNGNLCSRGFFGYGFVNSPERLSAPLLRKSGELTSTTWEEALDYVAHKLRQIVEEKGPAAVGGLGSPRATNEDNYLFQKFLRSAVGTPNVDSIAAEGYRQAIRVMEEATGVPGAVGTLDALGNAGAILIAGCDLAKEMPVASLPVIWAARDRGARLVIANPVETKLDNFATSRLRYRPGSEAVLLGGLMKAILEDGLHDRSSVQDQVENESVLRHALEKLSWEAVEKSTGVPTACVQDAARDFMGKEGRCVVFGHFLMGQPDGENSAAAAMNLALLAGSLGAENGGIFPSALWSNVQGLLDMGVAPDRLPGHQRLSEAGAVGKAWERQVPEKEGLSAMQMIDAIERGEIFALYLMGADPLVSFPAAGRVEAALKKLELLVVQDPFLTETGKIAHCVLPAATAAEKEGTFTNAERRIQRLRPAIGRKGQSLPDWKIVSMLAGKMGVSMEYAATGAIMQEISRVVPQYRGLSYSDLGSMGLQWPSNGDAEARGKIRERFLPVFFPDGQEENEKGDYPFTLLIGPSLHHVGTLTTRTEELLNIDPEAVVEINTEDATRLSIAEGDRVIARSNMGYAELKAKISGRCPVGVLWTSPHFPKQRVNVLTTTGFICRVMLEKKA